jgi:hypothetical protein
MPAISVFLSYARVDDEATYGRITKLKSDIEKAYTALSGETVGVFQDTDSINLGDKWRERIRAGLTSSSILLAFVSPAFLRSPACREELREFLGFLQTGGNSRLIIPLIFSDPARLIAEFAQDDIWQELSRLHRLPIEELRTADPGTSLWLTNVEAIVKRIEDVLGEAERRGSEITDQQPVDVPATADGTIEIFAEFEDSTPQFLENLEKFTGTLSALGEATGTETENMNRATRFSQRLAITNRLAERLRPLAKDATTLSADIKKGTASFDKAVRRAVQLIRSGIIDSSSPDTESGLVAIRDLATSGLDALSSIDELATTIDDGIGLSATLDRPLKEIKSAILVFAELRGVFRAWLDELESLQSDTA